MKELPVRLPHKNMLVLKPSHFPATFFLRRYYAVMMKRQQIFLVLKLAAHCVANWGFVFL